MATEQPTERRSFTALSRTLAMRIVLCAKAWGPSSFDRQPRKSPQPQLASRIFSTSTLVESKAAMNYIAFLALEGLVAAAAEFALVAVMIGVAYLGYRWFRWWGL